jgi:hypothetical protein
VRIGDDVDRQRAYHACRYPAHSDRNAQLPLPFRGVDDLTDDQVGHIIAIQKNVDEQVAQLRKLAIADQEVLLTDRQRAQVEEARAKVRAKNQADGQSKVQGKTQDGANAIEVGGKKLKAKADFEAEFATWRLKSKPGPGGSTETTGFMSSYDAASGTVRVDWVPWAGFDDDDKRIMAQTFSLYFKLCGEKGTVDVVNKVNGKLYLKLAEDGTITIYNHL